MTTATVARRSSTYTERYRPGVGVQLPLFLEWHSVGVPLHKQITRLCYFDALVGRGWRLEYLKFENGHPYYALFVARCLFGKVNVTSPRRLSAIQRTLAMYLLSVRVVRGNGFHRLGAACLVVGGARSKDHHARAYIMFREGDEDYAQTDTD